MCSQWFQANALKYNPRAMITMAAYVNFNDTYESTHICARPKQPKRENTEKSPMRVREREMKKGGKNNL